MFHLMRSLKFPHHPIISEWRRPALSLSLLPHFTSDWIAFFPFFSFPTCSSSKMASHSPWVLSEWVSDGHLFHFSLAKLKKRRPIPLPAMASCEWLSRLGLVQGLLMVLSVSVKSLRTQVSQETSSSNVWLELSTQWMNRGQLGCHGWNHPEVTNIQYLLKCCILRCCYPVWGWIDNF